MAIINDDDSDGGSSSKLFVRLRVSVIMTNLSPNAFINKLLEIFEMKHERISAP